MHMIIHVYVYVYVQVAEYGGGGGIVGVIRGCIKTVTRGISSVYYVKLAYILGLRVSPTHRYCMPFKVIFCYSLNTTVT